MMLKYDIIPIVVGGGNYSRFVPKSGYINAMEYPSAMHLAQYLKYLDGNVTAFNSYFQWKKHVTFLDNTVVINCSHSFLFFFLISLIFNIFLNIQVICVHMRNVYSASFGSSFWHERKSDKRL